MTIHQKKENAWLKHSLFPFCARSNAEARPLVKIDVRFKIKLIYRRPGFDIDAAIIRIHKEIDKRDDKKSIGYCARYVRWGLESGGINTSDRPYYACKYGPFFTEKGI